MLLENDSGFSRFLEFIRSVDDREQKNADDDVLDGKSRMGLSIWAFLEYEYAGPERKKLQIQSKVKHVVTIWSCNPIIEASHI